MIEFDELIPPPPPQSESKDCLPAELTLPLRIKRSSCSVRFDSSSCGTTNPLGNIPSFPELIIDPLHQSSFTTFSTRTISPRSSSSSPDSVALKANFAMNELPIIEVGFGVVDFEMGVDGFESGGSARNVGEVCERV